MCGGAARYANLSLDNGKRNSPKRELLPSYENVAFLFGMATLHGISPYSSIILLILSRLID